MLFANGIFSPASNYFKDTVCEPHLLTGFFPTERIFDENCEGVVCEAEISHSPSNYCEDTVCEPTTPLACLLYKVPSLPSSPLYPSPVWASIRSSPAASAFQHVSAINPPMYHSIDTPTNRLLAALSLKVQPGFSASIWLSHS